MLSINNTVAIERIKKRFRTFGFILITSLLSAILIGMIVFFLESEKENQWNQDQIEINRTENISHFIEKKLYEINEIPLNEVFDSKDIIAIKENPCENTALPNEAISHFFLKTLIDMDLSLDQWTQSILIQEKCSELQKSTTNANQTIFVPLKILLNTPYIAVLSQKNNRTRFAMISTAEVTQSNSNALFLVEMKTNKILWAPDGVKYIEHQLQAIKTTSIELIQKTKKLLSIRKLKNIGENGVFSSAMIGKKWILLSLNTTFKWKQHLIRIKNQFLILLISFFLIIINRIYFKNPTSKPLAKLKFFRFFLYASSLLGFILFFKNHFLLQEVRLNGTSTFLGKIHSGFLERSTSRDLKFSRLLKGSELFDGDILRTKTNQNSILSLEGSNDLFNFTDDSIFVLRKSLADHQPLILTTRNSTLNTLFKEFDRNSPEIPNENEVLSSIDKNGVYPRKGMTIYKNNENSNQLRFNFKKNYSGHLAIRTKNSLKTSYIPIQKRATVSVLLSEKTTYYWQIINENRDVVLGPFDFKWFKLTDENKKELLKNPSQKGLLEVHWD